MAQLRDVAEVSLGQQGNLSSILFNHQAQRSENSLTKGLSALSLPQRQAGSSGLDGHDDSHAPWTILLTHYQGIAVICNPT